MTTCEKCEGCNSCEKTPTVKEIAELIAEHYPHLQSFTIDDHDNAIVGIAINNDDLAENCFRIVYNPDQIIENCMEWAADYDEAVEYCNFNIFGAYMGAGSPLYVNDDLIEE